MFVDGTLHITIIEINVYGVGIPEDRFQKSGEPFYSNNEKDFRLDASTELE
jgi:hypothetical protein